MHHQWRHAKVVELLSYPGANDIISSQRTLQTPGPQLTKDHKDVVEVSGELVLQQNDLLQVYGLPETEGDHAEVVPCADLRERVLRGSVFIQDYLEYAFVTKGGQSILESFVIPVNYFLWST
uniref:NTF2 domain-containing protein n=1 Tax=Steinernema glaseri TaxID=37863 RepID=A0A1I8AH56_9BILA